MEQEIAYIKEKVDEIYAAVLGDPANPSRPGFLLRIDRLEQKSKTQSRFLWILCVGVVTALSKFIVSIFK